MRSIQNEGNWHHTYHQKIYGHQSEFGYKDIINLFDPTEMDFDELICLYKEVCAKYKTDPQVAHILIDIVSKNGNLLLSIPMHPNGSLQKEEKDFLAGFRKWLKINSEGIYETRPWLVFGEGNIEGTAYGVDGC